MSLQVWLPLNGSLENLGLSDLTFSTVDSSTISSSVGKVTPQCYYNDSGYSSSV
jgi:hypothetical protein